METHLETRIVEAAAEAGKLLRANAMGTIDVEWKKKDDPVTEMDRSTERLLKERIGNTCNYVGEEYGKEENGSAITLYLDPIDGTKSFVRREFLTSLSIGVEENGSLVGGVVYDFMRDIMHVAFDERGYVLNAGKASMPTKPDLGSIRIGVDGADWLRTLLEREGYKTVEKSGSIALTFAEVARGTLDALIAGNIGKGNAWDVAGGTYLCKQQGVLLYDFFGQPFDYKDAKRGTIAIRPEVKDEVLASLRAYAGIGGLLIGR